MSYGIPKRAFAKPLKLLLITGASIFAAEAVIMLLLSYLNEPPFYYEALIDASLLTLIIFPLLYLSLFRPMIRQMAEQMRAEEALQTSKAELQMSLSGLKEAEDGLKASEEQYRLMFENNPNPMWFYDAGTLRFLAVNNAAVQHYGYSKEEFLSMTIKDIRPEEDLPALTEFFSRVASPMRVSGVWRHVKKDGTVIYSEITSHVTTFGGTKARFALAVDVTERKKAEDGLKRLNSELKDALDKVKLLSGLLPICASCKKIRDDKGYWRQIESYISSRSEAEFTHSICPECSKRLYPELKSEEE